MTQEHNPISPSAHRRDLSGGLDRPSIALMTDLWPSRSEMHSGTFVRAQLDALTDRYRHVVLVPRLVAPALHRRVWGSAVQGWQEGHELPRPPARLLRYPMLRVPKGREAPWRSLGARLALALAHESPELVHAHFLFGVAPAAVRLGRVLGVPVVATAHGTDVRWIDEGGIQERFREEMAAAARAADVVVAVAADLAERLERAGVEPGRIEVIPMGIDATIFAPRDRSASRSDTGVGADERVILFAGRPTAAKGIEVLASALERLDGVRCVAAGPVGPPLRGIEYLGLLDPPDLARWMNAADLLCLPSFGEGSSVAVSEALACGTPVVASRVGGIPEQVRDGENGLLVPPGDPTALAEALQNGLSRAWSRDAIRASSRQYWWPTVAARVAAVYERLLA